MKFRINRVSIQLDLIWFSIQGTNQGDLTSHISAQGPRLPGVVPMQATDQLRLDHGFIRNRNKVSPYVILDPSIHVSKYQLLMCTN